jgi:hypothetical protein
VLVLHNDPDVDVWPGHGQARLITAIDRDF